MDCDALEDQIDDRTRMLLLCSPHNPFAPLSPQVAERTTTGVAPSKTVNVAGLKLNLDAITLTDNDRAILNSLHPVVDAIATLFGPQCEVLIHSIEDLGHSILKIRNGHVAGRSVGSPITDPGIKVLKSTRTVEDDAVGSYFSRTHDGTSLKSVTALIRNGTKPIGMLCINMNLSAPMIDVIAQFLPSGGEVGTEETPELYGQGIFDDKGAVEIVAKELGVSRYTVYNYIREAMA